MNDNVNHPIHYTQGDIECIDALKAATVGKKGIEAVCVANVIKYIWRFENKNGLEDVKKAQFYLNRLIQELEEKENKPMIPDCNIKHPDWTKTSEADCYSCKFSNCDVDEEPCVSCKNCYSQETEQHKNFSLKFQPKT